MLCCCANSKMRPLSKYLLNKSIQRPHLYHSSTMIWIDVLNFSILVEWAIYLYFRGHLHFWTRKITVFFMNWIIIWVNYMYISKIRHHTSINICLFVWNFSVFTSIAIFTNSCWKTIFSIDTGHTDCYIVFLGSNIPSTPPPFHVTAILHHNPPISSQWITVTRCMLSMSQGDAFNDSLFHYSTAPCDAHCRYSQKLCVNYKFVVCVFYY